VNRKKIIFLVVIGFLAFLAFSSEVSANWLAQDNRVVCGNLTNIPGRIPAFTSILVNVLQVLVPVLLVVFGIIDLLKAMSAQKEEDIANGRKVLFKRIIIGFLVFLMVALTKLVLNIAIENPALKESAVDCINCFINGNCEGG